MATKQAKQFLHAVKEGRDDKVEKLLKKHGPQVAYEVYDEAGYARRRDMIASYICQYLRTHTRTLLISLAREPFARPND